MMYDVIVAGGGFSGAIAAIGAAREGAKTLVVEQYGFLGGMLTAAGVGPMMTFHADKILLIRGIADEVIQRMVKKGKSAGHIFDTTGYTYTVTPFDAEGLKTELEEMAVEENVDILYHTMLCGVNVENSRIKSITVCNKSGLTEYSAGIYVDATGDADLSAMAGVKYNKGNPATGKSQAMTRMLRVNNVNTEACKAYIRDHDEEFPRLEHDTHKVYRARQLSIGGFTGKTEQAKRDGAFSLQRKDVLFFETSNDGEYIINTSHIIDYDNTDPFQYSKAEIEGRKQANEIFEMFKKYIPGFDQARLMYTGPFVGIRSSRQIVGMYTLTDDDIYECRQFPDAIAHSAYPVDVHGAEKPGEKPPERRNGMTHAEENRYYWGKIRSLPYRCIVNPVIDNLITVGRCTSVSYRAQGAFRTAPIVGAIGHAGGIAAALAAKSGIAARELNVEKLQERIRGQGGYIQTK
jgi:ribulose 1,5-bisphosphate synthetase/thiazole synthase